MTNDPSLLRRYDYAVIGPEQDVKLAAIMLLMRDDLPNGSSFAVGANAPEGMRMFHLTQASLDYLQANSPHWADLEF